VDRQVGLIALYSCKPGKDRVASVRHVEDWESAMDLLVAGGTFSLGILIGILIAYFVDEADKMDRGVLYGAVGVIGGVGVIAVFHLLGGRNGTTREYWFYPIGLLVGFFIGSVLAWYLPPEITDAMRRRRIREIDRKKD
jgi:MFS family permease